MPAPRVLQIVWNLIRGGTEGQCARVALGLADQDVACRVAVSRREGFFLPAVEQRLGPVYLMDIHHSWSPKTFLEIRRLARFIRDEKFDLVHAWDADAAIFGSRAARRAGVPFLTSRRDLGEIYGPRKLRRMEEADGAAAAVVVNAEAIGRRVSGREVVVIPNILDLDEFDRLAQTSFTLPSGRWIVHVARLDPEKDVATLLHALALVPGVGLVVAGDGVDRASLEKLSTELSLQDRVIFIGDVTGVPALLKRAEIAVLCPKSNEGLSNAILEYQAAGLPVIATDCGGNRELVRDGENGFIIPIGDSRELAKRLKELLDHPDRACSMGALGRQQVERNHRPAAVCAVFAGLYRRILQGRREHAG